MDKFPYTKSEIEKISSKRILNSRRKRRILTQNLQKGGSHGLKKLKKLKLSRKVEQKFQIDIPEYLIQKPNFFDKKRKKNLDKMGKKRTKKNFCPINENF